MQGNKTLVEMIGEYYWEILVTEKEPRKVCLRIIHGCCQLRVTGTLGTGGRVIMQPWRCAKGAGTKTCCGEGKLNRALLLWFSPTGHT